jgi:hypothetical protein
MLGLARAEKGAAALTAAGAEIHYLAFGGLDSLKRSTAQTDGVIHTAINNDSPRLLTRARTRRERSPLHAVADEGVPSRRSPR